MPNARTDASRTGVRGHLGRVRRRLVREVLAEAGDVDRPVRRSRAPCSAVVTTNAAPPEHGITISSRCSGVGDHARRQHVVDRDRLAEEHGGGVGAGADALVGRDLGACPLVPAVEVVVALRVHGVAAVLRHVAVGDVELGLRRSPLHARRAEHDQRGSPGRGPRRRRTRSPDGRAHHHVADAQLDGRRGPPHHADGRRAAEIDALGEVDRPAAVLGDGRGEEQRRLGDVAGADEPSTSAGRCPASARASAASSAHCSMVSVGVPVELALRRSLGDADDARVPRHPMLVASSPGRRGCVRRRRRADRPPATWPTPRFWQ